MANIPVEITGASLQMGKKKILKNVSFVVPEGKITVLVGPNGAGKTTTVRLVTGALRPQEGKVTTFGVDPSGAHGGEVRKLIGVVSAKPALYDKATGEENLVYAAKIYDVPKETIGSRVKQASEMFGIADALATKVGSYSTGMKTRLALARSIIHDPLMLIYDEPTSGLDPESSRTVLELIRNMAERGKTVLMCTHLLIEAENISNQIVMLADGEVKEQGTKESLIVKYFPEKYVSVQLAKRANESALLEEIQGEIASVKHVSYNDVSKEYVIAYDAPASPEEIIKVLVQQGNPVTYAVPFSPMLEDIYFAVQESGEYGRDSVSK